MWRVMSLRRARLVGARRSNVAPRSSRTAEHARAALLVGGLDQTATYQPNKTGLGVPRFSHRALSKRPAASNSCCAQGSYGSGLT